MPGQEKQKEFRSEKTTLKEREMWGGDVCDIESFVEEDGRINIKFIIFLSEHVNGLCTSHLKPPQPPPPPAPKFGLEPGNQFLCK